MLFASTFRTFPREFSPLTTGGGSDRRRCSGHPAYDVAPVGRFLMVKPEERASVSQISIVQNWHQELLERVPVRASR